MKQLLLKLWQDESGQDLAEYTMLLVLIAIAAIAATTFLGNQVNAGMTEAGNSLFTGAAAGP